MGISILKDTLFLQRDSQIQSRLSAEVGKQGIGTLFLDDLFQAVHGKRFNVSVIRHAGVGHDRCRVGVGENHFVTGGAQRFARLSSGIVKFACLSDDDGT